MSMSERRLNAVLAFLATLSLMGAVAGSYIHKNQSLVSCMEAASSDEQARICERILR